MVEKSTVPFILPIISSNTVPNTQIIIYIYFKIFLKHLLTTIKFKYIFTAYTTTYNQLGDKYVKHFKLSRLN